MKRMTCAELRDAYIKFFEEKGCQHWPSSSLIPDDPSLLLTVAGMVQFKPYFLQQKHLDPKYIGATTSQKCVRTNDIEVIGTDGRHLSFFEMLGNFSFGEYFKEEMCEWAWEFSTQVMELDPEKIYVTIYEEDEETASIWQRVGVDPTHISRLGEDDNFWRAGPTGPCGPCSELYYDQGEEVGCGNPDCAPGCDCDRFLEYWNCVFTQYDGQEDGSLVPLEKKNIDTGMGLERAAAILQGVTSNFDTDILRGLVGVGERLTGKEYGKEYKVDLSLRIMADHSRAVVFMIGDGILPSNEGRGYVLRRLLRRAVRHGHIQGIDKPFLGEFLEEIIRSMGEEYPEIVENKALIAQTLLSEEERFRQTLAHGEGFLEDALEGLKEGDTLSGSIAFTLHDTYGFPFELTCEICAEQGIEVDEEGFNVEMEAQRQRARDARKDDAWDLGADVYAALLEELGEPEFTGYVEDSTEATVKAIVVEGQRVSSAAAGTEVCVVLDKTPFYGEMGGQVGDTGTITADGLEVEVSNTVKPEAGLPVCKGVVKAGTLEEGAAVTASIDALRRARIARNHTATHILQKALTTVLGDHVKQAGSLVAPDRLRFDFTHFEQMHHEQIAEVERIANEIIMSNLPTVIYETSLTAARENGVLALFGEKYGEFVRVVEVGSFSKELCGGTHVGSTGEIGLLKIVQETSVGANTRRIEAVTSFDAFNYVTAQTEELHQTSRLLNCPALDVAERVAGLQGRLKEAEGKLKRAAKAASEGSIANAIDAAIEVNGYMLIVEDLGKGTVDGMREAWDVVKKRAEKAPYAVVFFARNAETGAPLMMAAANEAAVEAGFHAGNLIKAVAPAIKGGGGGKPAMAQAGGKDAAGIPAAMAKVIEILGA